MTDDQRIDIIRHWPDGMHVTAITVYSWREAFTFIALAGSAVVTIRVTPKGRIVVTLE